MLMRDCDTDKKDCARLKSLGLYTIDQLSMRLVSSGSSDSTEIIFMIIIMIKNHNGDYTIRLVIIIPEPHILLTFLQSWLGLSNDSIVDCTAQLLELSYWAILTWRRIISYWKTVCLKRGT